MRHTKTLMSAAITLSATVLPLAQAGADTGRLESHIPAQDLDKALKSFANTRGIRLQYKSELVQGLKTIGVDGNLTAKEELGTLLAGTGLTFQFTGENVVTLVPMSAGHTKTALGGGAGDAESGSLQLAQAGQGTNTNTTTRVAATGSGNSYGRVSLGEVIVTAEKRSEQLLSVPVPVTALEASDLQQYDQLRIQDYYDQVPGLQIFPSVLHGTPQLAVRGIIAGQGLNPTVGVTIDGVQYGSSTSVGGGNVVPDIDPSELARVEVLKGPQGTLYGANSLGGLLQYVTIDPSTDAFSGRVQVGASDVQNGDQAGYNTRAAVNIPITDTLAIRASGFSRQDPGYINDVTNGINGVNQQDVYGGRFAALWRPADNFSAKFAALFQHQEQFGSNYAEAPPGANLSNLEQVGLVAHTGVADTSIGSYALTLDYKFATFDLTSLSAYSTNQVFDREDESLAALAGINPVLVPASTAPLGDTVGETVETSKYSQELRLTTPINSFIDSLSGVYYTKENSRAQQDVEVANKSTGASLSRFEYINIPSVFEEEAAYTDFTFKISRRFDVQVGGRDSETREGFTEFTQENSALAPLLGLAAGTPLVNTVIPPESRSNSANYLVTPRYFLLSNGPDTVMTYARFSSGFRPGGPSGALPGSGAPLTYRPDTTNDYDLGVKADLLDRRLFVDLSLFYIDWKNIQISEIIGTNGVAANGSRAKSEGVELQTEVRPWKGLTIDTNFAYDDAVVTQNFPAAVVAAGAFASDGARLPFSAKYTAHLTVDQEFPLVANWRGFVGGQLTYVGNREGLFAVSAAAPRQQYPAYAETDLRGGVKWDTYTVDIYATNVTNRRGILSGGLSEPYPPNSFLFITPRTVGIELSTVF